ncbi:hypothetical protein QYE76_038017 [Lolium multiflorum]|uniref:AP2/ERF domain-containing protein n=1 Tax=Lolium multiflorum TaxID=4521 RepID=A0AAD8T739_LOLMU|nr:hypothetical protein QYE76_038017 [Lolium multiflorum]
MSSRASGFRGVRVHPSGRFTAEIRAGGFRLTLGTYNTPEEAARAYDGGGARPGHDINFPDVESLEEAEFLAPPPCLVTGPSPASQCARSPSPSATSVDAPVEARSPTRSLLTLGHNAGPTGATVGRRRLRARELEYNLDRNDPRWDDLWTETTSDDE